MRAPTHPPPLPLSTALRKGDDDKILREKKVWIRAGRPRVHGRDHAGSVVSLVRSKSHRHSFATVETVMTFFSFDFDFAKTITNKTVNVVPNLEEKKNVCFTTLFPPGITFLKNLIWSIEKTIFVLRVS